MKLWHESAGAELPASNSSSGGSSDGADGNFSYVPTPYFSLLVGTQRDMVGPPRSSRVPLDENNFPACFPPPPVEQERDGVQLCGSLREPL